MNTNRAKKVTAFRMAESAHFSPPVMALSASAGVLAMVGYLRFWRRHRQKHDDVPWLWAVRDIIESSTTHPARQPDLPVEIMPFLLLGDKRCANELHTLQAYGITHVLNVAGTAGKSRVDLEAEGIRSLHLSAEDEEGYPILDLHLHAATSFIQLAREAGGRCLVHCVAGINRSGVLATAALMLHEQLDVVQAVQRVKSARRMVLENHSFQAQLVALARRESLLGQRPCVAHNRGSPPRKAPRQSAADALRALG